MARKASATHSPDPLANGADTRVEGARLEPVRRVRRELVSPRGDRVVVEVPVYPPFRLKSEEERGAASG